MKMKRLQMRTTYAGPAGTAAAGKEIILPEDQADILIKAGNAKELPLHPVKETAVSDKRETAIDPEAEKAKKKAEKEAEKAKKKADKEAAKAKKKADKEAAKAKKKAEKDAKKTKKKK